MVIDECSKAFILDLDPMGMLMRYCFGHATTGSCVKVVPFAFPLRGNVHIHVFQSLCHQTIRSMR